jgi:hypothetical protein
MKIAQMHRRCSKPIVKHAQAAAASQPHCGGETMPGMSRGSVSIQCGYRSEIRMTGGRQDDADF